MNRTRARLMLAWGTIVLCLVLWPVSALTFARDEPATVLALSWLSPLLTAVNLLLTVSVRNEQDRNGAG